MWYQNECRFLGSDAIFIIHFTEKTNVLNLHFISKTIHTLSQDTWNTSHCHKVIIMNMNRTKTDLFTILETPKMYIFYSNLKWKITRLKKWGSGWWKENGVILGRWWSFFSLTFYVFIFFFVIFYWTFCYFFVNFIVLY